MNEGPNLGGDSLESAENSHAYKLFESENQSHIIDYFTELSEIKYIGACNLKR